MHGYVYTQVALYVCCAFALVSADLRYTGVNLAGAEFGESNIPGTYNVDYTYPSRAEVDYFVRKGMNILRVPFLWERLQPTLGGSFAATENSRLTDLVNYITNTKGIYCLIDPHNYARYRHNLIGSTSVSNSQFADFWRRLALQFKSNNKVIFGLMNEPHTMPTEQWRDAAQAAVTAIRNAGATNQIFVPGNAWTGAHSWTQNWYGTPNGNVMGSVTDPNNNMVYEVHQYLDGDNSGRSATCTGGAESGRTRIEAFTSWLRTNNKKGFLGEFAGADNTDCKNSLTSLLSYIQQNSDVWVGWSWWAAGPWWGDYIFTIEPRSDGSDRPLMTFLASFISRSSASATAANVVSITTAQPTTTVSSGGSGSDSGSGSGGGSGTGGGELSIPSQNASCVTATYNQNSNWGTGQVLEWRISCAEGACSNIMIFLRFSTPVTTPTNPQPWNMQVVKTSTQGIWLRSGVGVPNVGLVLGTGVGITPTFYEVSNCPLSDVLLATSGSRSNRTKWTAIWVGVSVGSALAILVVAFAVYYVRRRKAVPYIPLKSSKPPVY